MTEFYRKTSQLDVSEIEFIRNFISYHEHYELYFECALDDLNRGLDNMLFYISADKKGLILVIDFENIVVVNTFGRLNHDELAIVLDFPMQTEIHASDVHISSLLPLCENRLIMRKKLKYYGMNFFDFGEMDKRCKPLSKENLTEVKNFYAKNYKRTVFSSWMLDNPFIGLYENNELKAACGLVMGNKRVGSCIIGNFLVAEDARGKKFAQILCKNLIKYANEFGYNRFLLAAVEENIAAWKAYEASGFYLQYTRPKLLLDSR